MGVLGMVRFLLVYLLPHEVTGTHQKELPPDLRGVARMLRFPVTRMGGHSTGHHDWHDAATGCREGAPSPPLRRIPRDDAVVVLTRGGRSAEMTSRVSDTKARGTSNKT